MLLPRSIPVKKIQKLPNNAYASKPNTYYNVFYAR